MGEARTIGQRYELRGELASGGMATVHLARQLGAGGFARIVAVKCLHERFARDREFVAMFLDEGRLVARIRHPNVVQTLDVVAEKNAEGGSELFIVMEYVHGESLQRLLALTRKRDEPIPIKIVAAIAIAMLHGLHEAHEAKSETGAPLGIVHRDVSPHNVLVGIDGVARVLDFGVAKASERVGSTREGQLKGKLAYMSPEQIGGEEVDRRTDIYAAGVVIWEMLTGQKLFVAANEGALVRLVADGVLEPPSKRNGNIPAALDAAIMRALAKDPKDRFATALELASAIDAAVASASTVEVGAWVRVTAKAELDEKTRIIASIEAKGSSKNQSDAVASMTAVKDVARTQLMAAEAPTSPTRAALTRTAVLPASVTPSPPNEQTGTRSAAVLPAKPAPTDSGRALAIGGVAIGVVGLLAVGALVLMRLPVHSQASAVIPTSTPSASAAPLPPAGCPDGMVTVSAGSFFMGSDDRVDEKPAHKVRLSAFCIDLLEVSSAVYKDCSSRGQCLRAGRENVWPDITAREKRAFDPLCNVNDETRGTHPANCVDWMMASRYCEAQAKRLPTEAEWEYAARGSDGRMFPWGDSAPNATRADACGSECVGWLKKNSRPITATLYADDDGWPTTAPVGSFPTGASPWGALDMVGNVAEWVSDFSGRYSADDVVDPMGPEAGKDRVVRGAAWTGSKPEVARASYRTSSLPSDRSYAIGFRCAKTL